MNLQHFFHVYAGGDWKPAVDETFDALARSGLAENLDGLYVGMVGSPEQRAEAWEHITTQTPVPVTVLRAEADDGWEQVTLQSMIHHVAVADGTVLYTHTKGAWDASEINIAWRVSMLHDVIDRWRECVTLLTENGYDAAGPHVIPEAHGGPFFGGNFWWATGRHLRLQPPLQWDTRHHAENWIGQRPTANLYDLREGWPGFSVFWTPGS